MTEAGGLHAEFVSFVEETGIAASPIVILYEDARANPVSTDSTVSLSKSMGVNRDYPLLADVNQAIYEQDDVLQPEAWTHPTRCLLDADMTIIQCFEKRQSTNEVLLFIQEHATP